MILLDNIQQDYLQRFLVELAVQCNNPHPKQHPHTTVLKYSEILGKHNGMLHCPNASASSESSF